MSPPRHATPLQRLHAREIDLETYLELRIADATAHLGMLSPNDLRAIRQALRDRLASDPSLLELVALAARPAS